MIQSSSNRTPDRSRRTCCAISGSSCAIVGWCLGLWSQRSAWGLLATFLTTPVYRAAVTLQIEREPAKVVDVSGVEAEYGNEAAFYATQYELLRSRALAERVASNLAVEQLESFLNLNVVSPWGKLRQMLLGGGEAEAEPLNPQDVAIYQRQAAYKIMDGLSVQPVGTSRIVPA